MTLKNIYRNYISGVILDKDHKTQILHIKFAVFFGLFGLIAFTTYSIINFIIADYPIAILELILAIITALTIYLTVSSHRLDYAATLGMLPLIIISYHNFISGGFDQTGIFWSYTLPLVSIFVAGKRNGTIMSVIFMISTLIFFILSKLDSFDFVYSDFTYIMFLVSFSSVLIMTYIFQLAWDTSQSEIQRQNREIQETLKNLKTQITETQEAKDETKETLEKLKKMNQDLKKANEVMVGREMRMIELKKRIEELENSN